MKRLVIFSFIFLTFCATASGAEIPYIEGEELFNDAVTSLSRGDFTLNPIKMLELLFFNLTDELKNEAHFMLTMIIIAIISSITNVLSTSLGEKTSAEAAFFTVYALMSALCLKCFSIALEYTVDVTSTMCTFITKLSPAIMITLAISGKPVSAASFEPVLSGTIYIISIIIEKALIPLIVFGAILSIASNMSSGVKLGGFSKVINSVSKWLLAAVITIFTGVNAIYGLNAPALDAMSAKSVKFTIGTLVPVVGGFLSDTLETLIGGAKIMKNATGTAGIIAIVGICAIPIIKIGIIQFILRLVGAMCEPVTDAKISSMIWDISKSVTTLFAIVIMVAVLFIVNIAMIIGFSM